MLLTADDLDRVDLLPDEEHGELADVDARAVELGGIGLRGRLAVPVLTAIRA